MVVAAMAAVVVVAIAGRPSDYLNKTNPAPAGFVLFKWGLFYSSGAYFIK